MENRTIENLDLDKDYEGFHHLSKIAWGHISDSFYKLHNWLFNKNPFNPPHNNLMFVMKDGDKIIASDGLMASDLYVDGKILKAAYSIQTITDPDYRKQGIFTTMTNNSVQNAADEGFDVVLGLGNKYSTPGYKKFGWEVLFEKEMYIRPVNIDRKLKKVFKAGFIAKTGNAVFHAVDKTILAAKHPLKKLNATVDVVDVIPECINEYWDTFKGKYHALIARDYRYLNFRYNMREDASYKTLLVHSGDKCIGFAVLRELEISGGKMSTICESFTDPDNESYIAALSEAVIRYGYDNDIEYFVLSTGMPEAFHKTVSSYLFIKSKNPPSNNIMLAKILTDKVTIEELKGYNRWHLTQGDAETDIYIN